MEENCNTTNCSGIYNYDDLVAFLNALNHRESLNPWQDENGVINLRNNIDLGDQELPRSADFSEIFDGNHHSISGLKLRGTSYCALFLKLKASGILRNLEVIGTIVTTGSYSGLVGINEGLIQNCSFRGDHSGPGYLGGITGFNEKSGRIIECKYTGNITNGTGYCSGITGLNEGVIIGCQVNCNIESKGYTGLITGLNRGTISRSICTGSVTCVNCYCGGITGCNEGDILGCDCSCNIYGTDNTSGPNFNVGGIAGINGGNINSSTFAGQIQSKKHGGIAGLNWKLIDSCLCKKLITTVENAEGGGIAGSINGAGIIINSHNEFYNSTSKYAGRIAYTNNGTVNNCTWRGNKNEKGIVKGNDSTLCLDTQI